MQQYQRLIYTVCLQFVHDPPTAEDLTQDTFLSAFTSIDRCDPPPTANSGLCAWRPTSARTT